MCCPYIHKTMHACATIAVTTQSGSHKRQLSPHTQLSLHPIHTPHTQYTALWHSLHCSPVMAVEPSGTVATLLALLEATLGGWQGPESPPSEGVLERMAAYCLAWSVGGLVRGEDRPAVDAHLRSISDALPPKV